MLETTEMTDAEIAVEAEAKAKKEAQKALRQANERTRKAAEQILFKFTETKPYAKLPEDVQEAIIRLATKPSKAGSGGAGGGFPSAVSVLSVLFPTVGDKLDELEIFKRTKKGRSEFRKFVKLGLQRAQPADRMWVSFDAETEEWTYMAVGETEPADYNGPGIPVPKNAVEAPAE